MIKQSTDFLTVSSRGPDAPKKCGDPKFASPPLKISKLPSHFPPLEG